MRAVGLALSVGLHALLLGVMSRLPSWRPQVSPQLVEMTVQRVEPPPPPAPPPPPPPPLEPKPIPKPEVKPIRVKERTVEKIVQDEPPPAAEPPPKTPPPPPQGFSVDMSNTVVGGGVAVPAVEGGGNMFADPNDRGRAPGEKTTAPPPPPTGRGTGGPVGAYQITEEPRFVSSEAERTPPYPPEAKAKQVEGAVMLRVFVAESGRVTEVRILKRLGSGTDEIAVKWAKEKWRFSPARAGTEAVGMWITVPVRFVLER